MAKKIDEMPLSSFPFPLASYQLGANFSPAVWKETNGLKTEYRIRILVGKYDRSGRSTREWDYFTLDETGLIIVSPHGFGKEWNKQVRITNMDSMVLQYKEKRVNHG